MRATLESQLQANCRPTTTPSSNRCARPSTRNCRPRWRRACESFVQAGRRERLEQVHEGLGEMQQAGRPASATCKRVLTNVKSRGVFGEVQLGALAGAGVRARPVRSQRRTPCPAATSASSSRCACPAPHADQPVWLPIDAKFPREDYERLLDAQERADVEAVRASPASAGTPACALEAQAHPRQIRVAAAHHRLRDPVPADRRPVRGSAAPAGPGRRACSATCASPWPGRPRCWRC